MAQDTHEYRQVTYRLLPGSRAKARKLAATAGAPAASSGTRFLISRSSLLRRRDWRERTGCQACRSSRSARPSRSFDCVTPWLQEMPCASLSATCSSTRRMRGRRSSPDTPDRPRFKRRGRGLGDAPGQRPHPRTACCTSRRSGRCGFAAGEGTHHSEGEPVQAVIRQHCGKWYATVCYRVERRSSRLTTVR